MWDNDGKPHVDKAYRLSATARLDRDHVIKGIEDRARALPFYRPAGDFMPMVVQSYGIAGVYRDHFDVRSPLRPKTPLSWKMHFESNDTF
jgi:prolyl 4-hydroxylase